MAAFPSQLIARAAAAIRALVALTIFGSAGCTLDQTWTTKSNGPPAAGRPCEMAVAWINKVQYAADVVHNGVPTPGLVGRLYLFDQTEKYPVVGDGAVTITLYDDTKGPATQPMEQWYLDPVAFQKFLKKDLVGWGYTIFLPWGSCRPDVTTVHLTCKYEPANGPPIFGPVSPLALERETPAAAGPVVQPPARLPQLPTASPLR